MDLVIVVGYTKIGTGSIPRFTGIWEDVYLLGRDKTKTRRFVATIDW